MGLITIVFTKSNRKLFMFRLNFLWLLITSIDSNLLKYLETIYWKKSIKRLPYLMMSSKATLYALHFVKTIKMLHNKHYSYSKMKRNIVQNILNVSKIKSEKRMFLSCKKEFSVSVCEKISNKHGATIKRHLYALLNFQKYLK